MENTALSEQKKFQNIFLKANETRNGICPVRDVIARISDKWSMLTIYALGGYGTLRFNEIKKLIGDLSQRMLTVTLRNLETDGLVERKVFPEVPPRVEYNLTPLGFSLLEQLVQLGGWAEENSAAIIKNRKAV
ncbi:helix-turn-helix domain-containing protein [Flavobacterium sp.]|uniref:winged helix-turn-helix transcriptional regulator n=1 Tax=Flavobacterium sp. TaxID=239 RepID=UPI002629455B|nr:helix-turn-helix domain-containing protein [Flavobacterium sp.]